MMDVVTRLLLRPSVDVWASMLYKGKYCRLCLYISNPPPFSSMPRLILINPNEPNFYEMMVVVRINPVF